MVISSFFAGADMITFFAPASRCFFARLPSVNLPVDSMTMFRVPESYGSPGGTHVVGKDNEVFAWSICCKDILQYGGDRSFEFFHTGTAGETGGEEIAGLYGSHIFDPGSAITPKGSDFSMANYIVYAQGDCPGQYQCVVKASPLDTNGFNFYNSHVWPCETTFNTINLTSICYKPEKQTNCQCKS